MHSLLTPPDSSPCCICVTRLFDFFTGNFTFEQSDVAPLAVPARVVCAGSERVALNSGWLCCIVMKQHQWVAMKGDCCTGTTTTPWGPFAPDYSCYCYYYFPSSSCSCCRTCCWPLVHHRGDLKEHCQCRVFLLGTYQSRVSSKPRYPG